jgi:hypothetical protein
MSKSKLLKILSKEQYEDVTLVDKIRSDYKADASEETQAEFKAACENFRKVCEDIQAATGIEGFKGGFDEMLEFQNSPVATTAEGLALAMKWSAADKLCTYIADRKLKIGQPAWWKRCWGIED